MKLTVKLGILLSVSFATLSGCLDSAKKSDPTAAKVLKPTEIAIGMSSREFTTLHPGTEIPPNGQVTRPSEIHGLRGEWTYSFYAGRLSWYVFNSYESNVSAATFRQYLAATRSTVNDYTKRYGKPDRLIRGILEFKDPNEGYPGYPVLQAAWTVDSETLRVDYSVLGNVRENAQLLFTVEVLQ